VRHEPSRRTQRKQQTTGAEDGHQNGGSVFAQPSLLESRRRQRLLEPGSGRDSHLKPAIEGFSGWCAGWERGPRFFVRLRSSLPDQHDPASRAIKACVGWPPCGDSLKPYCLAKSALLVSKRSQRGKRGSTILNDEGQGRRKPGGDPGCGRKKRIH